MDDNVKRLENELRYLTTKAKEDEIEKNKHLLEDKNVNIKEISKNIYISRGLDITKINNSITTNMTNEFSKFLNSFKEKEKSIKIKMIIDIVYMLLLLILLKIPFDLVRDIGYEYIEIISTNNTLHMFWNLGFLILYTLTIICAFITLLKNFNNKYNKHE